MFKERRQHSSDKRGVFASAAEAICRGSRRVPFGLARIPALYAVAVFAFNVVIAADRARDPVGLTMTAYQSNPARLEIIGRCPLASPSSSAWQSVISVGKSAYTYPYFLLRENAGRGFDVVFFNDEGKGYYVETREISRAEASIQLAIDRRGGGEAGQWKLRELLTISRASPGYLDVVVDGEETSTKLLFFKSRESWRVQFRFQPAELERKLFEDARGISAALVRTD